MKKEEMYPEQIVRNYFKSLESSESTTEAMLKRNQGFLWLIREYKIELVQKLLRAALAVVLAATLVLAMWQVYLVAGMLVGVAIVVGSALNILHRYRERHAAAETVNDGLWNSFLTEMTIFCIKFNIRPDEQYKAMVGAVRNQMSEHVSDHNAAMLQGDKKRRGVCKREFGMKFDVAHPFLGEVVAYKSFHWV